MNKNGIIMIVAIIILLLLTVLAMAMIGIGWVGKITATSYIEKTQSEFMTQSAIELATTKIIAYQNRGLIPTTRAEWLFQGEDFNRNGRLDPDEDTNNNGLLDTANLDLQSATIPSFPNPEMETISLNNRIVVPSLVYKNWGGKSINSYTFIKAVDTSSLICVNNIKNRGLKLILNNLSEYLNVGVRLGDLLFEYLVANENVSLITPSLLEKIWGIPDKNKLNTVMDHLSFYCWEDKKVLQPSPPQNILNSIQNQTKVEISSYSEINSPSYTFGVFSPLNINLAPIIIIKSTLNNLSAISFTPYKIDGNIKVTERINKLSELGGFWQHFVDTLYKPQKPIGYVSKVTLTAEEVEKVAEEIEVIRSARFALEDPLAYNWEEFFIFVENLIGKNILSYEKSALIFANANPNLYSYKFNTGFDRELKIDRLNLIDYSTIYTFFPLGIFKIEAYNVVLDRNNQIVTRSHKGTYTHLYHIINETTISDFESGVISSANYNTLNKKSMNIGPFPRLFFPNLAFPDFDGFLEFSTLVPEGDINILENMKNNTEPILIYNLSKNNELKNLLKFNYPQIKKMSPPDYPLLWDGVDYNLLDNSIKNQYIKIFSHLFQALSQVEVPVNVCFWMKMRLMGGLQQKIVPLFNMAGFIDKENTPFSISFFNIRKTQEGDENPIFYNLFNSLYNITDMSIGSFAFNYFVSNAILKPPQNVNTIFPSVFSLVCLYFGNEGMEVFINGNHIKKQNNGMENDIQLEKITGNINIEKTLTTLFFNGTIDYAIYIVDGKPAIKENEKILKSLFPSRYCIKCDDISYTTKIYQVYTLDRNCILNLYWTDNTTATNLPDIYTIIDRYSLFDANILDKNGKVLNANPYDTSVGDNPNEMVCTNEFKVRLTFSPPEKEYIVISPIIDDLYIFVLVPRYKQILFSESEKFR